MQFITYCTSYSYLSSTTMSVDVMVYGQYKPALLSLALTISSLVKPCELLRSMSQGYGHNKQAMGVSVHGMHRRLARPALMLPAKWSDKISRQMLTE